MIVAFMALVAGTSATSAQEQEGKLVDRILKPNMSLVNSAQNKQFGATGISVAKRAPSKSFCTTDSSFAKSFPVERAFSPRKFAARHFRAGGVTENISARSQRTKADTVSVATNADTTRMAPEDGRSLAVASFAGSRSFLDRGKSQKALTDHDTPLTIEQVRELLNKNK